MLPRKPLVHRWRQQKPRLAIHLAKIAHPPTALVHCSTLPTGSPSGWRETGRAKPSTSRKPIPRLRSPGRAVIASTDRRLSIRTVTLDGPPPSSATRSISSPGQLGRKFQTSLVRLTARPNYSATQHLRAKHVI